VALVCLPEALANRPLQHNCKIMSAPEVPNNHFFTGTERERERERERQRERERKRYSSFTSIWSS
jgi:hypothetical protein